MVTDRLIIASRKSRAPRNRARCSTTQRLDPLASAKLAWTGPIRMELARTA
jgi:hypothetical protein